MISRHLNLSELLKKNTSAFLLGPRGTGKSTLAEAYLAVAEREGSSVFKVNLLSLADQTRYTLHPELFRKDVEYRLQNSTTLLVVLIDEVQKVPALLDEVHYFIESVHKERVQFLLTGSSARKIRRGSANLLAGRAASLTLHPISILELELNLERCLQYGSLPKFYLLGADCTLLLEAYVDTYLKEEIQSERLVRSLAPFHKFLLVAAQMNGKPINFSALGRDAGISDQTARDYYSIMLDTYLAFELPAWSRSIRKQIRTASKFYLFDCGVLNVLLGEIQATVVPGNRRYGGLFENFVITEFFRQKDYLRVRQPLYYWQTADNYEVDLIIDCGLSRPPIAIEIKSSDDGQPKKIRALQEFKKEFPDAVLVCISRTQQSYMHDGVEVLPWHTGIKEVLLRAQRIPT